MPKRHILCGLLLAALFIGACQPTTTAEPTSAVPAATATAASAAPTEPAATAQPSGAGAAQLSWDAPPEMTIDPAQVYLATFKTDKGDIKVELFADKAPVTVNNFIFLARQGYYDSTTFHRVLANFMAQGGDPTGTGSGGPGYQFQDEFHPDLRFDEPGLLAMANAGPGTNGSQFFITFAPTSHLNGRHTIFGKVVEGMENVLALRLRDPDANPDFAGDTLQTVIIEEAEQSLLPAPTATPVPTQPVVEAGRPLAEVPVAERANLFTGRPAMVLDPAAMYVATIATTQGDIEVELYAQDAPETVNNFYVLANLGYWDDFPIVYVEPGRFVLTGSPDGSEQSDVGYSLPQELNRSNTAGTLAAWFRTDLVGSSGSQFFINLEDNSTFFDPQFTVFGAITSGLDVAGALTQEDRIESITVEERS